ncbi:MAG TPA: SCO family protein [Usitatibacter sp.]|jgi:protein SCO1/2|nr:SCO family protein [Usitatibacter sp.]
MKRLVLAALMCLAARAQAHFGPHPEAGVGFDQHLGAQVALSLPFIDARGIRETLGDAIGAKPTVLLLGYVRCKDLCALTLPGAAKALDAAGLIPGRDYRAIFASIDAREGPGILAGGSDRLPATDRGAWTFLGANEASAQALTKTVGFHYRYEPERDAFAHPEGIVVLSPQGRISRYLFGASFDASDVRLAVAEAGQGRTGKLSDRLLLLCYHFDPTTGRYTLTIFNALRALIAALALAAAWFGWRMLRPHRARGGAA